MGQEFFINSQNLEDKIRELFPSQGGAGAGFDLSASTQIIPIVDLTESAEGSGLRQDLQSSFSHNSMTSFNVNNATNTVIVSTTGYFRVFGNVTTVGSTTAEINLFDTSTSKTLFQIFAATSSVFTTTPFDFIVFIAAGNTLRGTSSNNSTVINGCTRQLADISGNLVNPL
jgi:hypothetical protein